MPPQARPSPAAELIGVIRDARRIAIRVGSQPHRFTSLWAVVVGGRVFIRSWSLKPGGWYRTLLGEPQGVAQVARRELRFRAVHTRSQRLRKAVDRAYRAKYDRPADIPYTRGMTGARSRATTTELVLATGRR
jgi:hypothetical protein